MSSLILMDVALLVTLMILGVPVALTFVAAAAFLIIFGEYNSTTFLITAGFSKLSSVVLLAIPLYILAGGIMTQGGIAKRLLEVADSFFGRYRSGLGVVTVITTAVFGAISGMASSAVAAIGSIAIPRMVERGYDRGYATALVSCSAVLALLIPPSATMILYGWVTGTSIAASFLAPLVPALLLVGLFSFWNMVLTRKMEITVPEAQPLNVQIKTVFQRTREAGFGLAMPLIILGFIYGGITTPTEAAAVAVVYALPVAFLVYRELTFKSFYDVVWKAAQVTSVLMLVIFTANMLARVLTLEEVPQQILETMLSISDDPIVLLLLVNGFLLLIGMFMEDVSGILLAAPLLLPVVTEAGVHPVHFAAIIGTNLGMGLITPPTAPILYFGTLIGQTSLAKVLKPTLVFVFLAYMPVVLLTTFVPILSMWLPMAVTGIR
ncbi:Sialic acid TRAP transporter permease protein SiaT [Pseudovibrio sp. Ad13]|uniref:TRAP transporter large permease n=1 Tax=unclassified Pseudovibrio TaxID=2627060 RepID=UPI0007AEB5A8|nr:MULTISPECIES: TRAP transporter large permease [unclassified Pseudovibrio]KZK78880.1 Sialic acid TRAP transporter permease protein SiaT [Pseudovibrio sp. Ad46]KZK84916.1 Sialic acid TRAP transporter permease protein SiaT [Pseudovibrio sp. Ad13]KZK93644.1 Sialic acid TRAP transporter permease protein SiaT [Pseudovibrio sp. Ad5]KZK95298.1 Sialic acid TRAP transporter permease protein SiaT [Pseudovibrio sp. W74]KZL07280.1 Sialic acid TRAP transporter permease protein SiaT [Pseudovibrio sp. Ad14